MRWKLLHTPQDCERNFRFRAGDFRSELEEIQFAFLDRFQANGEAKLIARIKDAISRLSNRDENADALVRFASGASVLEPHQGTEMMLRFSFPKPLPPIPTEEYPA